MKVYIGILAVSTVLTMGTFFYHNFLHRLYDVLLVLPIWLGWFLPATALYVMMLYLISLTVDPSKTVRKKEPFFRWPLNQTVWLILHLGRVEIQSTGLEKLEGLPPFLIIANHCSNFDPFIAIAACPQADLAYIAKPEIFDIPITGRIVHQCFFLPISRTDNRSALGTIKYAAKLLQKGIVSFGIYPEETRSKSGELLPFRNGAFQIAKRAGAPIVIAKTTGTEQIARRFAQKRTIVQFDVLDVLDGITVTKLPTNQIGAYARSLMLGETQTTIQKEANIC